jgi:hypothetical protein
MAKVVPADAGDAEESDKFDEQMRPDGSGCQGGVGASRGAKQADPDSARRAGCNSQGWV